ncbi:MAG TPA: hypothetical protein VFN56_00615 [Candidatus Saccharimonadales bacterium]|nr:hypothetical protein [Candidatus Saccharimonadales bacterium]
MDTVKNSFAHMGRKLVRPAFKTAAIELLIVVTIAASFVIEMAHIATTKWLQLFLYNGDSLTLPIIFKSLQYHEPIQWVFSSQLNLFPEAILYALGLPFTHSTKIALFINAAVNVLIFYLLIRLFLKTVTHASLRVRQILGLLTMLLLILCMVLESSFVFGQTMVTYLLFNTYYTGPLFVGMLALCSLIVQIKHETLHRRQKLFVIGVGIITTLAISSNPLYILQFSLPFLCCIAIIWRLYAITRRNVLRLGIPQLVPVIIGLGIRQLFLQSFIGQSTTSHLTTPASLFKWKTSFDFVIKSIAPVLESTGTHIRIFISVFIYFGCLIALLFILNVQQKRRQKLLRPEQLFSLTFIVFEPIVLIGSLYTGSTVPERYLISSYILLFLSIPLLADFSFLQRYTRAIAYSTISLACVVIVGGTSDVSQLHPFWGTFNSDEACLAQSLHYEPANGLADYWVARPLDVYNSNHERVLQVLGADVYPWLNNLGAYQGKTFTFYVEQRIPTYNVSLYPLNIVVPPSYSSVSYCTNFVVYHYPPHSLGYTLLNHHVQNSLHEAEVAREHGAIPALLEKREVMNQPHDGVNILDR